MALVALGCFRCRTIFRSLSGPPWLAWLKITETSAERISRGRPAQLPIDAPDEAAAEREIMVQGDVGLIMGDTLAASPKKIELWLCARRLRDRAILL
jgi:hypothetical protein